MWYYCSMDDISKAMWCAGFFQGEGWVGVSAPTHSLAIKITQYRDRTPLDRFASYMGTGSVLGPYLNNRSGEYEVYQYAKMGIDAEVVTEKMLPFLTGKKLTQAEMALSKAQQAREARGGFNKKNRPRGIKEFCKNGHDLRIRGRKDSNGYIVCKDCHAASKRKYNAKKKKATGA